MLPENYIKLLAVQMLFQGSSQILSFAVSQTNVCCVILYYCLFPFITHILFAILGSLGIIKGVPCFISSSHETALCSRDSFFFFRALPRRFPNLSLVTCSQTGTSERHPKTTTATPPQKNKKKN